MRRIPASCGRLARIVIAGAFAVLGCGTARADETPAGKSPHPIEPAPAAAAGTGPSIPLRADSSLVRDLKGGGYVIFFRHAATNWEERDQKEGDFVNRAAQRNLSPAGRTQAKEVGVAIAALKLPIEKVVASPMWRCRDTAELAFGAYDTTGMLYFKGPRYREARITMLSTAPAQGKNLVLVGHQDQLIPIVPGLARDQLKEGDALVIQPLGQAKFRVVSQVTPADWARLAGTPASEAAPPGGGMKALPADSTDSRVPERCVGPPR